MKKILYRIIYEAKVNYILRNLNKGISGLFGISFKLAPSGTVRIEINGQPLLFETNQTSYITQYIFWNGYKNFEYTPIFEELIKNIDSFFDIGANIGYYSLVAAKINPSIRIVAFEPSNGAFHYLQRNIEINKLSHLIRPEKIALFDKSGSSEFYEVKNMKYDYIKFNLSGEANLAGTGTRSEFNKYVVECKTLDEYFSEKKVETIDLIKIDTEGCEDLILRAGESTIRKFQPIIICETLYHVIEEKLEQIMRANNYRFFNHVGNNLVEVKTIVREKDDGVRNCFFVPPSKINLIEKFLKLF